jgi:hypothetical protein
MGHRFKRERVSVFGRPGDQRERPLGFVSHEISVYETPTRFVDWP